MESSWSKALPKRDFKGNFSEDCDLFDFCGDNKKYGHKSLEKIEVKASIKIYGEDLHYSLH